MSTLKQAWRCAVTEGVPKRSFIVALVVGTILNFINQGDTILGDGRIDVAKLVLTFVVPYAVCTYGAVSSRMRHERLTPD